MTMLYAPRLKKEWSMSKMKAFLMGVSRELGLEGELTEQVLKVAKLRMAVNCFSASQAKSLNKMLTTAFKNNRRINRNNDRCPDCKRSPFRNGEEF